MSSTSFLQVEGVACCWLCNKLTVFADYDDEETIEKEKNVDTKLLSSLNEDQGNNVI